MESHDTNTVTAGCFGSVVLAVLFVLQVELVVDHIVEHHAHGTHVEEQSYPGILASDILGTERTGQSSHSLKETYVLGDEPWDIMN